MKHFGMTLMSAKGKKISVSVYVAFCHPAENDVLGLTLVECGCDYIRDTA